VPELTFRSVVVQASRLQMGGYFQFNGHRAITPRIDAM